MEHQEPTYSSTRVSPEVAQAVVLNEMYGGQRPFDEEIAYSYAIEMMQGTFRPWTVITFAILHGKRYLINGQHTMQAIIIAGATIPLTYEDRVVSSLAEVKALYRTFDRNKMRTIKTLLKDDESLETLPFNLGQRTNISSCLPLLASGFAPIKRLGGHLRMYTSNVNIRSRLIHAWTHEADIFFQNIKGAPGKLSQNIRRSSVLSVALVTLRFTGTDAEEFWHKVAMPDGLSVNDPRHRLHIFLRTSSIVEYEPHVLSRYVAVAWNAAYEDRTPRSLQPGDTSGPIRLAGTPHTGEQVLRYITPQGELLHDPQPYNPEVWQQEIFHAA